MKPPLTYYGGKQQLASYILTLFPPHTLYCEPFVGGAALFFAKPPSEIEVLNDTNKELINFYQVVKTDFERIEREIAISLHSRFLFRQASVVYNNPEMFGKVKRASAVWVLAMQGFSGILDSSFGYDKSSNTTTKKVTNKQASFTLDYAKRLQNVQLECTDALRIIKSRDTTDSFFYCDPPYYNSDMGHYDNYTIEDFENLLKTLAVIQGKFLLSSYPSDLLQQYAAKHGWRQVTREMNMSVNAIHKQKKRKVEVLTANYPLGA